MFVGYSHVAEELIYRGFALVFLRRHLSDSPWRTLLAILISSALFCLAHTHKDPGQVVGLFFAGALLLAVITVWSRSLSLALVTHAALGGGHIGGLLALVFFFVVAQVGRTVGAEHHDREIRNESFRPLDKEMNGMSKSHNLATGLLAILLLAATAVGAQSAEPAQSASPVQITSGPQDEYEPQWSPDGSKLSYGCGRMGDQNVAIMDLASGEQAFLTEGLGFVHATTWSPDGREIAYVTGAPIEGGFVSHVYIVALKDKTVHQFTHVETIDGSPAWSPDGKFIAFPSERSGVFNLWVQGLDGSAATMVTDDPALDHGPEYSPDGQSIAFHSQRGGSSSIWIYRIKDGRLTQLTGHEAHEQYPDWSPDGKYIAFDSTRSGNMDIWIQPVDGGEAIQVTSDPAMDMRPSWSPDGKRLAFSSDRSGSIDVWVVDAPQAAQP